jgi:gamma-glutamylcyclotransferase (GGCT)/AIG2-like uncharacterized protein YtfP
MGHAHVCKPTSGTGPACALSRSALFTMENSSRIEFIAFYGSLMRGFGTQAHLQIEDKLELVGACQIFGALYDLGEFPALATGATNRVRGELYRIKDAGVVAQLDAYEEFNPGNLDGSLFVRRRVRLAEPDVDCWVYFYNHPPPEDRLIPGGSWSAHQRRS